jgi:6-pyruvoyltetrahydropterin/6-carboxytetrahydropterin synthase
MGKTGMTYRSTKTFGHNLGISCAFRQWRADSHCNKIHGYALSFQFIFEAGRLDHRNWVVDFGGLKKLKQCLFDSFDHKLVVAQDDPELETFKELHRIGVADVVILPAVGCERFAKAAYQMAKQLVVDELVNSGHDVRIVSVEVREHGSNSAIYMGE